MPRRPILFLAMLGVLLGIVLVVRRPVGPSAPTISGVLPPARSTSPGRGLDPAIAADLLAREAQRAGRRASVWAPETDAEVHEELFIQLWDALRNTADPVPVLGALPFDSIELPELLDAGFHDVGIRHRTAGSGRRTLAHAEWIRQLGRWRDDGWRLDGSEWRMPRFNPAMNGLPIRSGHTVEFHLLHVPDGRRVQLAVDLDVAWTKESSPGAGPVPSRLSVRTVSWLESDLPPRFELAARDVVTPPRGAATVDPLIVRDLDGDGRDEIILLGKNRVYLNRGPGRIQGVRLCPRLDTTLAAGLVADIDGDGIADVVGADGQGLVIVRGEATGRFDGEPVRQPFPEFLNPWVITAGDVDGDGDLDLWVAQYKVPYHNGQMPVPFHDANDGFPSYLLRNDGHGHFTDITVASGLDGHRNRRTYSASLVDIDDDGDLDLVNVSDFAGVDLYLNDGTGRFIDVTVRLPNPKLFGMAHAIADFDDDGRPDLLAIGMNSPVADRLEQLGLGPSDGHALTAWRGAMTYGNRLWLNGGNRFVPAPFARQVAATGWSWGVAVQDFDHDGDLDLWIANGHKSRASARDYDTEFWTSDIYQAATAEMSPGLDAYFQSIAGQRYGRGDSYGGHQRNRFLQRGADGSYRDTAWLQGVALPQDCRNVAAADLDLDGRLDLIVTTVSHEEPFEQAVEIHRGTALVGPWVALRVAELGPGLSPQGVRVDLETDRGRHSRWIVSGDSYRTQNWPVAWFGLPGGETPVRFTVHYPGKRTRTLENPPVGKVSVLR